MDGDLHEYKGRPVEENIPNVAPWMGLAQAAMV